jgi:tripartite-type tricarboxylate transporter receptor subunit TctC
MTGARFVLALAWSAMLVAGARAWAAAPDFPNRPLRYIVPFAPGGSTDIFARIVADALTDRLGQQVIVDNRAGVGGLLGAQIAARSTPDGYTIFACNIASLALSPALYRKPGYDPDADFSPIGLIGSNPNALGVNLSIPATTVAQFITYAKSRPGQMNYASAGVGTSPQLSMELFKRNAGIDLVHIPYKGGGPQLLALLSGEVQTMFATVPLLLGPTRSGKVRTLGVTSTTRAPDLPDVPTIAESGMPGFEVVSWQGLCTPTGVPQPVLAKLRAVLPAAVALPDTRRRLAEQGIQVTPLTHDRFAAYIRSERAKWTKLIKDIGIPPQ